MRKIFFLLSLVFVYSCQDNPKTSGTEGAENALFTSIFRDYRDIEVLSDHEKVSDTSIHTGGAQDTYRLLRLRKNSDNLVLFYKVVDRDSVVANKFSYRVLDTIHINEPQDDERISIGYCKKEGVYDEEIIAVVKNTDSIYVTEVEKAWRANPHSEKIEALPEVGDLDCLNEFFTGENTTIPVEKIS